VYFETLHLESLFIFIGRVLIIVSHSDFVFIRAAGHHAVGGRENVVSADNGAATLVMGQEAVL